MSPVVSASLGMSFTVATVSDASDMDFGKVELIGKRMSCLSENDQGQLISCPLTRQQSIKSHSRFGIKDSSNNNYKIHIIRFWLQTAKKSATTFMYQSLSSQWAK